MFSFSKKGDGMKGNYTILKIIPDDLSISYLQKLKVISTWFVDLIPISTSIPKHSNSPGQKDIFFLGCMPEILNFVGQSDFEIPHFQPFVLPLSQ